MNRIAFRLALVGLAVIPLLACQPRPHSNRRPKTSTDGVYLHAVHNERLRALMAELNSNTNRDWPQELEGDMAAVRPSDAERLAEAVQHARSLADAARQISSVVSHMNFPEVDRRSFDSQADTLYEQAQRLERAAQSGDRNLMRRTLSDIEATCNSCHTRFRDVAGPLMASRNSRVPFQEGS